MQSHGIPTLNDDEIEDKIKIKRNIKPSVRECTSDCHSYLSSLHVEVIPGLLTWGPDKCKVIITLGVFYA